MAVCTGKFYDCSKTNEIFELVYCDDGDYMINDSNDKFVPVVKNKYSDDAYNEIGNTARFFTRFDEEGEKA